MNSNFRKQTFFLLLRFRQVFKSDSHLFIFRLSVNWCTEVHSALSHQSPITHTYRNTRSIDTTAQLHIGRM